MGHVEMNHYLHTVSTGIRNDPVCNNCEEGPETVTHFICECDMRFAENFIYTLQTLNQCRTV